jgi:UDP-glucuronate 4-epimerase
MKTLVTGAAGFIGSRLARRLLDRGDAVVGIDNFDPYYAREHKDRHLRDLLPDRRFAFIEADLRDAGKILDIYTTHRPDGVAHMAAMAAVRYSMHHPLIYGSVNVQGTMHLLDAVRQTRPAANCVIASTGSVYGTSTPVPFPETAAADRPLAPYPASKRAMELMAHCYHHLWQMPTSIVRFFNVYGPHGRPDMMPWQWTLDILAGKPLTLYNAGRIRRDWTYIDDIVTGLTLALDKPAMDTGKPGYEILNLGCANPVENLRFVEVLESLLGKKAQIIDTPTPPTEPMITYADITKARRVLGYEPKVQVEEGLRRFVEWMKAEGII